MKNIIIIIVLFAMTACLYSQTEPTQVTFTGITGGYINAENNQFYQNKIQTGFIWSSDFRMNEVMGVNSFWSHNYYYDDIQRRNYYYLPEYFTNNSDLIMQLWGISSCSEFTPMNNISFQYEPTLKIDNVGEFKSRSNDPTKSVFGFRNYRTDVVIGENDTELILYKLANYDLIMDPSPPVINNHWPSDQLFPN